VPNLVIIVQVLAILRLSGRRSRLLSLSYATDWWDTGVVICVERGANYLHMVQHSSWCHCHPTISCSSKIQNGSRFWCRLIQVVPEKSPLDGCSVVVVAPLTKLNLKLRSHLIRCSAASCVMLRRFRRSMPHHSARAKSQWDIAHHALVHVVTLQHCICREKDKWLVITVV